MLFGSGIEAIQDYVSDLSKHAVSQHRLVTCVAFISAPTTDHLAYLGYQIWFL